MFKQIYLLLFSAALLPAVLHAQSGKTDFNHIVTTVTGDLNKDKLPDSAIVLQDTLHTNGPYRLQIFFKYPNGNHQLILQNDSAIEPEFYNGKEGFLTGTRFSHLDIRNGVLTINTEQLRGHYEYKFRYQKGYFALIGFMQTYSDGQGIMTTTDFNLSTGVFMEKTERYDSGKIPGNTKKTIKVNPLPNLKNFKPFSTTLY